MLLLFLFYCPALLLQAQSRPFEQFARVQDSLMMKAYYAKDPRNYLPALAAFEARYNTLPEKEKVLYRNYYVNGLYNLACTYSLLNQQPQALQYFKRSVDAGYTNYAHLQEDTDLDNIRNEASFRQWIQPLRELGDYRYILSKAATYNPQEQQDLPAFTYQPATDPDLVALRQAFHLDSIAGQASEVSRILNLLHWVHNLVPHDGNHENPAVRNALSMIRQCKQEGRGLNCRGLATVLNECYLALGIPSRFVTCLPKDSLGTDPDCHVINMVYSKQLQKWLWIDPTFDAYVMDEKGGLLGIEEVRQRIIDHRPLLLNPGANWNNKQSQTKEYYLYQYMAKNLYMLECPVNSRYNTETRTPGKSLSYIRLIPLDYFKKSLEKTVSTSQSTQTTMTTYRTNNPAAFWQTPQPIN